MFANSENQNSENQNSENQNSENQISENQFFLQPLNANAVLFEGTHCKTNAHNNWYINFIRDLKYLNICVCDMGRAHRAHIMCFGQKNKLLGRACSGGRQYVIKVVFQVDQIFKLGYFLGHVVLSKMV